MADRIRFHLDEHVDPAIAAALHRASFWYERHKQSRAPNSGVC